MAENDPNPNPPAPPAAPKHLTCPSCGSVYSADTAELVTDTHLLAKVRELEGQLDEWKRNYAELKEKHEFPPAPTPEPEPVPEPKKKKDFFVA